jgi:hypothetical protein
MTTIAPLPMTPTRSRSFQTRTFYLVVVAMPISIEAIFPHLPVIFAGPSSCLLLRGVMRMARPCFTWRSLAPAKTELRTCRRNWIDGRSLIARVPPIFDLYLGRSSPEAVLEAAKTLRTQCETDFYVGEWHLIRNNRDEARRRLQLASTKMCEGFRPTYPGAVGELQRMVP